VRKIKVIFRDHPEQKLILAVSGAFIFVLSSLKLPSASGSSSHPTGTGLSTAASFQPPGKALAEASPQDVLADASREAALTGSNNWVIAPSRTATGRPILANDPHRALGVPSLRYIVHLNAPGLDVIGAGEPALPGISIGHNQTIAFGLTIFGIDQEDLYVYDLNPKNPHQYRYQGRWEDMTVVREPLAVKGEAPRAVELDFTRHGPVLHEDGAARLAYALRSVWSQPGAAPYMASLAYLNATTPAAYGEALAHWVSPSTNHVYADVDGAIAWFAAGSLCLRSREGLAK